jgi:hypothetical protein
VREPLVVGARREFPEGCKPVERTELGAGAGRNTLVCVSELALRTEPKPELGALTFRLDSEGGEAETIRFCDLFGAGIELSDDMVGVGAVELRLRP